MRSRVWGRRIGALVVTLLLVASALWIVATGWQPSHAYAFEGLDLSEEQGPIDWWAVRGSGANFAYLRATNGTTRDTRFERNWADIAATGMRRGALHRYSLCRRAADQANAFNTTVSRTDDALPAAVELDFTPDCTARPQPAAVLEELRRYLEMVEAHTRKPVLLKIARRFDTAYHLTAALPRPVWAMQNFLPPDYTARPWRMWQASDMRRIDGVEGPVNWDVVAI